SSPPQDVASGNPMIAISFATVGPCACWIAPTGRIVKRCGTLCPPTAMIGGASTGSPCICSCAGGGDASIEGRGPLAASATAAIVGANDPPALANRRPSQGKRSCAAGGWLVVASLPEKQSPPPAGAPSARSARPLRRITLSRTVLSPFTQRFRSKVGITAIP